MVVVGVVILLGRRLPPFNFLLCFPNEEAAAEATIEDIEEG